MHISIPVTSGAFAGHREFDAMYGRDENDQAQVFVSSTDDASPWDPVENEGSWVIPGVNWGNPEPDIVAGLATFSLWATATITY